MYQNVDWEGSLKQSRSTFAQLLTWVVDSLFFYDSRRTMAYTSFG
jgi:hypothetical protein